MTYLVKHVDWDQAKNALMQVRERVFVYEYRIPRRVEFDHFDQDAHHVLMLDEFENPIATGRLLSSGHISRVAVLCNHRCKETYQTLYEQLLRAAELAGLKAIHFNCILDEVDNFLAKGYEPQGEVFMEAGIPRQTLRCTVRDFDPQPMFQLH